MKAYNDRKITGTLDPTNSLSKILLDVKEEKLRSRQKQILNIVKNTQSNGVQKFKLISPTSVSSKADSNSSVNNYKMKTRLITPSQKEITQTTPNTSKINQNVQKKNNNSKEPMNSLDKNYLNNLITKNIKYSNDLKINNAHTNHQFKVHEKRNDGSDEIKFSEDLSVEIRKCEDFDMKMLKKKIMINKKISLKDTIYQRIQKAIKDKKIFLIRADIPYLDKIFEKRGWIKKYESTKTRHLAYGGNFQNLDKTSSLGDIHNSDNSLNEKAYIYNELKHITPNFIWDCRNYFIQWKGNIKSETFLNRFEKSVIYTSKLGLASFLEKSYWFYEENISDVLFPRSYDINIEKKSFIDDYRKTAAVSFVRWFVDHFERNQLMYELNTESINTNFYVSLDKPLKFAIERCEEIVSNANDVSLDNECIQISSKDWDWFIECYNKFVHTQESKETDNIKYENDYEQEDIMKIFEEAKHILQNVKDCDPQYDLNGIRNIWILKPNMSCCGYGIIMTHKLDNILAKVDDTNKNYYLVQKYIENPLLVKNTKFDVRQWFLVTKSCPLTIWIYKESLLRFSSRPFTFDNYHEIIHICNTAVQNKYSDQKNLVRTSNWDCDMLNLYLKENYPNLLCEPWYDIIYPKMCQAIVATMLTTQDYIDQRKNSFELYGADFVIMQDLSVWLIEINTNPRMHPPSSKITERLYPEVLESLVKVIYDYPLDNQADTGNFVLIYQQDAEVLSKYNEHFDLTITGKKINKTHIFELDAELDQVSQEQC